MLKKLYLLFFILLLAFFTSHAQSVKTYSSSEIKLALKKLNTVGSVLYIAAHPDDENTRLLAYLATEKLLRTGYLALNRGDGGQNLIGGEQGELLGLIRTQELLAARRIDGAEQFFTRANDFGYSKNPEESLAIFDKEKVLADVVWTIRKFKPDVIITRFPTTGEGGHGHHTASAILAGEAFKAAADPKRFPEQLKYVQVWQARSLWWNTFNFSSGANTIAANQLKIDVGIFNPLLGKGYCEIAAESRTMHKSQGFGVPKSRGSQLEYFKHIDGDSSATDLFVGIDQTWNRVAGATELSNLLNQAYKDFNPEKPADILPVLIKAFTAIQSLKDTYWKAQKKKELEQVIMACSGLWFDAVAADYSVSPGNNIIISTSIIARNTNTVKLNKIAFTGGTDTVFNKTLLDNELLNYSKTVTISENIPYSTPYWLVDKHEKGMYKVDDQLLIGSPENIPAINAIFTLSILGQTFNFTKPVSYTWIDPIEGEKYRPLEIAPEVTATIDRHVFVFSNGQTQQIKVVLKSHITNAEGTLQLNLPEGWKCEPASVTFSLKQKEDEKNALFTVSPPIKIIAKEAWVKAVVNINGKFISKGLTRIQYNHIPVQTLFPEAEAKMVQVNLVEKGKMIGYIVGAGDDVPNSLRQIGYDVTILTDEALTTKDLSGYDAIVVGIRAFNTNERMQFYHQKLMDYVNNGGNMIVQYNTNNFLSSIKGDIGSYPFKISRDRVTVEEAPMNFDNPQHPLLNTPNKITNADFEGWVQERGIYFATDYDSHYETIFSCNDPGEKSSKGSLIVAKYGKGNFIYTGLVFFRELPAGVLGAYRLFANMISLGK
jgi:LmbE family N-acetylglucosaminyl deacetylase